MKCPLTLLFTSEPLSDFENELHEDEDFLDDLFGALPLAGEFEWDDIDWLDAAPLDREGTAR